MSYYIYDIDGTLADTTARQHFVRNTSGAKKDWKSFFHAQNMLADSPNEHTVNIAQKLLSHCRIEPVYCTGRPDNLRSVTIEWLETHVENDHVKMGLDDYFVHGLGVHRNIEPINDRLFMRQSNDHRDDNVVKPELVRQIIEKYGKPLAMFEDRDRVVRAVRAMGVPVFQVADGDF